MGALLVKFSLEDEESRSSEGQYVYRSVGSVDSQPVAGWLSTEEGDGQVPPGGAQPSARMARCLAAARSTITVPWSGAG